MHFLLVIVSPTFIVIIYYGPLKLIVFCSRMQFFCYTLFFGSIMHAPTTYECVYLYFVP